GLIRKMTTSSPIWTNCWSQMRAACGTRIRKHCSRHRDDRGFDHRLRIGKGATAGPARFECPQAASATPRSESEQSARSMDCDAPGISTNISKERRALDANGTGRAKNKAGEDFSPAGLKNFVGRL